MVRVDAVHPPVRFLGVRGVIPDPKLRAPGALRIVDVQDISAVGGVLERRMDDEDRDLRVRDQSAVIDRANEQEMMPLGKLVGRERGPRSQEIDSRKMTRVVEGVRVSDDVTPIGSGARGPGEADRLSLEDLNILSR